MRKAKGLFKEVLAGAFTKQHPPVLNVGSPPVAPQ